MKPYSFLSLVSLLAVCCSCIIGIEEDNFNDFEPVPSPENVADVYVSYSSGADVSLFFPLEDTIWIATDLGGGVAIRLSNNPIYGFEANINGVAYASNQDGLASFSIGQGTITPGNHRLMIRQFVKSGTGSLADQLDAELAAFENNYVLSVGPISYDPQISISFENGNTTINWNRYSKGDFVSYTLIKSGISPNLYSKVLSDQEQVSSLDSTFIGENVEYWLEVNRWGQVISSDVFSFASLYHPDMRLAALPGGGTKIEWNLPPFYNNIESISIALDGNLVSSTIPPTATSFDIADNIAFGDPKRLAIGLSSVTQSNGNASINTYTETLTVGVKLPAGKVQYDRFADRYYLLISQSTQDYSFPGNVINILDGDLKIIDSKAFGNERGECHSLILSPDGNFLYLHFKETVLKVNPTTLEVVDQYLLPTHEPYFYLLNNYISASNNGRISFMSDTTLYVSDFNTKSILFSKGIFAQPFHLNESGEYLVSDNEVYKFDGASFQLESTLPFSSIRFARFIESSQKMLIATNQSVYEYDFINKSIQASYDFETPPDEYASMYFDQYTSRYIVFFDLRRELKILLLGSGVSEEQSLNHAGYFFSGNYYFSSSHGRNFAIKYD